MKFFLITVILAGTILQSTPNLEGSWKLVSNTIFDEIRSSPGYIMADFRSRELVEKQFTTMITEGRYNFQKDTLLYTDMEGEMVKTRRALWSYEDSVITISEIDRPFEREAYVHYLSPDSMALSPMINGEVGVSVISFRKETL